MGGPGTSLTAGKRSDSLRGPLRCPTQIDNCSPAELTSLAATLRVSHPFPGTGGELTPILDHLDRLRFLQGSNDLAKILMVRPAEGDRPCGDRLENIVAAAGHETPSDECQDARPVESFQNSDLADHHHLWRLLMSALEIYRSEAASPGQAQDFW